MSGDWTLKDDEITRQGEVRPHSEKELPSLAHGLEDSIRKARGHKDVEITLITRGGEKYTGMYMRMERWQDDVPVMITLITGKDCCTDCWPGGGHTMRVDEVADVTFLWQEGEPS